MRIPALKGIIRRRLLVNYRVGPEVIAGMLPAGFRPKVFRGWAIAGICLIRLEDVRPKGAPAIAGIRLGSSKPAASGTRRVQTRASSTASSSRSPTGVSLRWR